MEKENKSQEDVSRETSSWDLSQESLCKEKSVRTRDIITLFLKYICGFSENSRIIFRCGL